MLRTLFRRCMAIALLSWMAFGAAAAWAQVTVEDFLLRAPAEEYWQLSASGKKQVRSFAADIWVPLQNIYAEQRARRGCSPEKDMDAQDQRLKDAAAVLNSRYPSRRRQRGFAVRTGQKLIEPDFYPAVASCPDLPTGEAMMSRVSLEIGREQSSFACWRPGCGHPVMRQVQTNHLE